jgi:hypothetical protein
LEFESPIAETTAEPRDHPSIVWATRLAQTSVAKGAMSTTDKVNPVFLATTSAGLRRAASESGTWKVAEVASGHVVRCLAVDPVQPMTAFAGSSRGVLRSMDGGLSWTNSGLDGIDVRSLAVSRARPDRVVAGTRPARIFLSDDRGLSWSELEAFRRIPSRRFLVLSG